MGTIKKKKTITPDPTDWFQVMDRAFIIQYFVEASLADQLAIEYTPALKKRVEKAVELLADVYQYAAKIYFETTKPSNLVKPTKSNGKSKSVRGKPKRPV